MSAHTALTIIGWALFGVGVALLIAYGMRRLRAYRDKQFLRIRDSQLRKWGITAFDAPKQKKL